MLRVSFGKVLQVVQSMWLFLGVFEDLITDCQKTQIVRRGYTLIGRCDGQAPAAQSVPAACASLSLAGHELRIGAGRSILTILLVAAVYEPSSLGAVGDGSAACAGPDAVDCSRAGIWAPRPQSRDRAWTSHPRTLPVHDRKWTGEPVANQDSSKQLRRHNLFSFDEIPSVYASGAARFVDLQNTGNFAEIREERPFARFAESLDLTRGISRK